MSLRHLGAATAAAAIAILCAAPGLAQALDPNAEARASASELAFDPGQTQTATWTVRNAGSVDGTATITLQIPAGWGAQLAPADRSFALAAGASRSIPVSVSSVDEAPTAGDLVLSATVTDGAGRTSPPSSAPVTLIFVPAPLPPPPRDYTAEIVGSIAAFVALAIIATSTIVYLRRARHVALFVDAQQRAITTGTDGIFLVQVENRGRIRREVELRVEGLPATWYGAFSFPKVVLQPGERAPVPLCVKVPGEAGDGQQVQLRLSARPSSRFPWLVHAGTRIEAHDRVRIGAAAATVPPGPQA